MAPRLPRINDITTDFERPPLYWVRPPARPEYNARRFRAKTEAGYPGLGNLTLAEPPDMAYWRVVQLAQKRGWRLAAQDDPHRRVQAVAITRMLRFRDDVVVEVRPGTDGGSVVAMRSKSRLGVGDLGANAKRIREFFADLAAPDQG